jgi:hypothetical protein
MASTFEIHASRHWTFQLVLLGSRLQLEGWCDPPDADGTVLRCTAWVDPLQAPSDVAHSLMRQPSCCL